MFYKVHKYIYIYILNNIYRYINIHKFIGCLRSLILHECKIKFVTLYLELRGLCIESFALLIVLFWSDYLNHFKFE